MLLKIRDTQNPMSASILKLPSQKRKQINTKPLTALRVKNHTEGILTDAHPYKGLRIRANKNGTKTYFYRYRMDNRLKQIKLGTYPGMTLSEAREALLVNRKLREKSLDPRMVMEERKQQLKNQLSKQNLGRLNQKCNKAQ